VVIEGAMASALCISTGVSKSQGLGSSSNRSRLPMPQKSPQASPSPPRQRATRAAERHARVHIALDAYDNVGTRNIAADAIAIKDHFNRPWATTTA
jgi:hypothetical protein